MTAKERADLADGLEISQNLLKTLGDDIQRNLLVIQIITEQVSLAKKILVFACSVSQAHMLAEILAVRGIRAAAVSSNTPPARRRQILADYKQHGTIDVLINYGVLTTGFDAPKTNVVVVARPTQSVVLYSQMIGRAMRGPRAGGNDECTVVTVKDAIPGFRSVYEGFSHWEDVWAN
jgi:DNA repair protein RadD